jgi:hypothetical protein
MKKFIIILFAITLSLPLYAQADDDIAWIDPDEQEEQEQEEQQEVQPKPPFSFARQKFEFGNSLNVGFSNDLIALSEFFKENLVLDMDKLGGSVGKNGFNLNLAVLMDIFLNVKGLGIAGGVWDFGLFVGPNGNINFNMPNSLFTLIAKGNNNPYSFEGMVSASGGIYANAGLSANAKFGKISAGVKPALFAPLIFIPKSGIKYRLDTEESISLYTSGDISIYSPFLNPNFQLNYGFDITMEGGYALLPFLDVGGSISRIPIAPAVMRNRMRYTLSDFNLEISGEDIMSGNIPELPSMDFRDESDTKKFNVFRPIKFDIYARYKPFNNEFLVLTPNIGFSVDINDKKGYFNAGADAQLNLMDLFIVNLGTKYEEAIWTHRLALALNLRFFQRDLGVALRSQSFTGSFKAQGIGFNLGLFFGY